jgi:hypothetical protein
MQVASNIYNMAKQCEGLEVSSSVLSFTERCPDAAGIQLILHGTYCAADCSISRHSELLKIFGTVLTGLGLTQAAAGLEIAAAGALADGAFDDFAATLLIGSMPVIFIGVVFIMVGYFTEEPAD